MNNNDRPDADAEKLTFHCENTYQSMSQRAERIIVYLTNAIYEGPSLELKVFDLAKQYLQHQEWDQPGEVWLLS